MSAIGPGDWVEAIQTSQNEWVRAGSLYCVEAIVAADGPCPVCADESPEGLVFIGMPKRRTYGGFLLSFCPCRFRPVYRPNSDFIEILKQPAPERELEDA